MNDAALVSMGELMGSAAAREENGLASGVLPRAAHIPGESVGCVLPFRVRGLEGSLPAKMTASLFLRGGEERESSDLLNRISVLSSRETLSGPDWEELRQLVSHAVRRLGQQAEMDMQFRLLALTDELTGLYNRRGFLVLAMHQLKLCVRSGQRALLFFADVDGLKRANDTSGHASGDELLIRCGCVLKATFRESDLVARLDGDEFAVLAVEQKGTSEERISARLAKGVREVNAKQVHSLSLSVGAARFDPSKPLSLAELLVAADRAMYQQKQGRRENRAASKVRNVALCGTT